MSSSGFEPVICLGVGATFEDHNRISKNTALDLGKNLLERDQEVDTLLYSCPHWPLADTVEILEKMYNVTIVSSFNAIIGEGLRSCGIKDQFQENGRLLREY